MVLDIYHQGKKMKKFTIAAIAMAFAGSAFAGDQDSADIHFAGEVQTNICTAALLGAALVSWADWLGQVLIAPAQIPAGTLASIIGAGYFLILLVVSRR